MQAGMDCEADRSEQWLFKEAREILESYGELLRIYVKANKESHSKRLPIPAEQWKRDESDMKRLLTDGRVYGENLAMGIILPAVQVATPGSPQDQATTTELPIDLFNRSRHRAQDPDESWARVTCRQIGALTAVARLANVHALEKASM